MCVGKCILLFYGSVVLFTIPLSNFYMYIQIKCICSFASGKLFQNFPLGVLWGIMLQACIASSFKLSILLEAQHKYLTLLCFTG